MKTFLNVLGCLVVLAVAAVLGQTYGLFHAPGLDIVGRYGTSVTTWAKGGFQGSPTAGATTPDAPLPEAVAATTLAKDELTHLIGESKKRAIAKHPDLTVANSELNSRFVFRYNYMVKEGSPRLQESNWPEKLADECAAAAQVHAKPGQGKAPAKGPSVVSKKMVADAGR